MNTEKRSHGATPRRIHRAASGILYLLWITAIVTFIVLLNTGQSPGRPAYPPGIMTSDQVRPGMRGYGLTVFKGTRVERFPVVVMGRIKNALGESDMILVRVLGGYPVIHRTGIIAGMSGSPVYINGRLIGAIGYGWGFSQEPVGGVTPIEHMLRDLDRKGGSRNSVYRTKKPVRAVLEKPLDIDGKRYFDAIVHRDYTGVDKNVPPGTMVMSPVPSLLQVQGFNPRTIEAMKEKLKPFGLEPVAVPGGNRVPMSRGYRVRPGSAIGVTFVGGDLFIGGTGTVTYRRGDAILAFGHPMMQLGSTNLPMNAAYIEGIMPGLLRPFKFSSSMGTVGTLTQDRAFAISGRLGVKPETYPMTVRVQDVERKTTRNFNLKISRLGYLNTVLMYLVAMDATNSSFSDVKWTTAVTKFNVKIKGYEPIRFEDYVSSPNVGSQLPQQVMKYFRFLGMEELGKLEIEKVSMDVRMYPDRRTARILDLSTQFPQVRPGDRLEVKATLEDPQGRIFTRTVKIPIPSDLKKGVVKIGVAGGDEMMLIRKKLRIKPVAPSNIHQVVDYVRNLERCNELTFLAAFPAKTVIYSGIRINDLPSSKQYMLRSSPRGSVENSLNSHKTSLKLPYFIQDSQIIAVQVSNEIPSSQDTFDPDQVEIKSIVPKTPGPNKKSSSRLEILSKSLPVKVKAIPMAESKNGKKTADEKAAGTYMAALADARDYFMGNFKDTSIIEGNVTLGKVTQKLYTTDQAFVMAMTRDQSTGTIHLVEAPGGDVVRLTTGGKPQVIGNVREVLSPCMVQTPGGDVFIGTGPNGRIFRVTPEGKLSLFATLPQDIIWDLKVEPSGSLLAACGNRGAVYRIDPSGRVKLIFKPSEAHVTALALCDDGSFFAGCSNEGSVYKVEPTGKVTNFYCTSGSAIDSILYRNGDLWIASEELVYKVGGPNKYKVDFFPEQSVIKLAPGKDDSILVGTSAMGRVYRINKDGTLENLYEANINQVTAIHQDPSTGEIYAATGNPGGVIKISPGFAKSGAYLSRVIDTGNFSNFGNITWTYSAEKGTSITMQSRSGNTTAPDSAWSRWSSEYTYEEGQKIMSPPGRFIQIKAILRTDNINNTPMLYETDLYYRHVSQAPLMEFESPDGAPRWSGSKDIKWKVFVTNPSVLAFDLFWSPDGGDTWKPLKKNILPKLADLQKAAKNHNQKPLEMKYKWNTRKVDDDYYLLKVVGYDRTDPENKYLKSQTVSKPVTVSNKAPEVTLTGEEMRGKLLVITGFAKGSLAYVKEVHYRIGRGKWNLAFAKDGIFDNTREKFHVYLNPPYPKRFRIEVKAIDETGNSSTDSKSITVSSVKVVKEKPEQDAKNGNGNNEDNDKGKTKSKDQEPPAPDSDDDDDDSPEETN